MIRTIITAAIAALLATSVQADPLDQRLARLPVKAEAAYCGLAVADAVTTASVIHRGGHEKISWMIGKHPSDKTLAFQAIGKCAGHAAITSFLQDHFPQGVKLWEVISIGVQGGVVVGNLTVRF